MNTSKYINLRNDQIDQLPFRTMEIMALVSRDRERSPHHDLRARQRTIRQSCRDDLAPMLWGRHAGEVAQQQKQGGRKSANRAAVAI